MFRRLRPHLSYANVMATVAVFITLGGGAYAASQIDGNKLKNRSVAGTKIRKNTLGGTEIKESRLGKVPRAANADRLDGQPSGAFLHAGQPAGGALAGELPNPTLRCPAGTTRQSDFCFDSSARAAATWFDAIDVCAAAGRRLGTPAEMYAVGRREDTYLLSWTSTIYDQPTGGGGERSFAVYASEGGAPGEVNMLSGYPDGSLAYRCVVSAGNP